MYKKLRDQIIDFLIYYPYFPPKIIFSFLFHFWGLEDLCYFKVQTERHFILGREGSKNRSAKTKCRQTPWMMLIACSHASSVVYRLLVSFQFSLRLIPSSCIAEITMYVYNQLASLNNPFILLLTWFSIFVLS